MKRPDGTYASIVDMQHDAKLHGNHWFDQEAMRFFDSRIESDVIKGKYFISSEQFHYMHGCRCSGSYVSKCCGQRMYTIHEVEDGEVKNFSKFQEFSTLDDAIRALDFRRVSSFRPVL